MLRRAAGWLALSALLSAAAAAPAQPIPTAPASPQPRAAPTGSPVALFPRPFLGIGDQGLRIDARGIAHAAFVGDAVYYGRDGAGGWRVESVAEPPAPIYEGTYQPLPALALDRDGEPHLAFLDPSNRVVRYARRRDGGWQVETVARAADGASMNFETAIAIDPAGVPHVAYGERGVLMHARRSPSGWVGERVDWRGFMEMYFSLRIDGAGVPQVTYFAASSAKARMKYARRADGRWRAETIDRADFLGEFNSLALDRDGAPHVSYLDVTNSQLKYARRASPSGWQIAVVDTARWYGGFTSIAVDGAGHPRISYTDGASARYAAWDGGRWRIHPIAEHAAYTALALEADGTARVAYFSQSSRRLLDARWTGTEWTTRPIAATQP